MTFDEAVLKFFSSLPSWLTTVSLILGLSLLAYLCSLVRDWPAREAESDDDIPTDILAARELKAQKFAEARRRRDLERVVRIGDYRALPKARGQR